MDKEIKKINKKDMELDGSNPVERIQEINETPKKHGERKERKKKKKDIELDGSNVTEPIEDISETSEKHCEKKAKKKKKKNESDVEGENSEKSDGIHDEAESESRKDKHRKKKGKKKEIKEKGEAVSSSRERLGKLSNGEEEGITESGLPEDDVLKGSKERVDAVSTKRKKGKGRKSDNSTFLSSVDHEECQISDTDGKKKRKRTYDNGSSEYDEQNRMEKGKNVLGIEDERAGDSTGANVKKIKKSKKNGSTFDSSKVSPDRISDEHKINKEGITEKGKENLGGKSDKKTSRSRTEKCTDDSEMHPPKKKSRVKFSGDVEVFPPTDSTNKEYDEDNLIRGRRFSKEEDDIIRDAVSKYIEMHQLGKDGLRMVLYASKYPRAKGCWKEIGASLPWRPEHAVYARAHIIFERSEKRGCTPEENEIIKRFHAEHGPQWKKLGELIGKQRVHVKDAWRRIKLPNRRWGAWSQEEYQTLFDLVNMDLRMKVFDKKKDNVMLRENISWEAISEKLSTRVMDQCCLMWYNTLASSMVRRGEWADSDDYRLIYALQNQEACCVEEIDWDSLLENRSGEVCQKRWHEMCRHIGGFKERTFLEQLDLLSKRYQMDMLEYRNAIN